MSEPSVSVQPQSEASPLLVDLDALLDGILQ